MKLKIFIGAIMALCLLTTLSACRTARPPVVQTDIKDSTSTVVEHIERDTTITAPSAKTELEFKISDLQKLPDGVVLKSQERQAGLQFEKKGDKLKASCNCDTLAIQAKLKDTYTNQNRVRTVTNNVIHEVKYIPFWVRCLAWCGGVALVGVGILVGFRLYNIKR